MLGLLTALRLELLLALKSELQMEPQMGQPSVTHWVILTALQWAPRLAAQLASPSVLPWGTPMGSLCKNDNALGTES